MKKTAGLLALTMVLTVCLQLVGCGIFKAKYVSGNTEFKVTIEDTSGFGSVNFEITNTYRLTVELLKDEVTDETVKDVQIEYNQDNAVAVCTSYSGRTQKILYTLYFYELGQDDELRISYKGKTIKINYNVTDYDFEKHGYITVNSIDDLNIYPEFKEMLLSTEYYEFKEPYVGIEGNYLTTVTDPYGEALKHFSTAVLEDEGSPNYANNDYLKYLKDSVYYPSRFYMVPENPVSTIEVSIRMPLSANMDNGSGRESMSSFGVSYNVIDPCCTNPQHPLRSMSFYASQKDKAMTNYLSKYTDNTYPSQICIFLEKYPEQFFVCEINGLTVYILCLAEDGARAYFEDGSYFYTLTSSYEK